MTTMVTIVITGILLDTGMINIVFFVREMIQIDTLVACLRMVMQGFPCRVMQYVRVGRGQAALSENNKYQ
ncbi:hypothetical protein QWI17_11980 [Gilvimarinus sp. SDUM040013]|uniref:Uncharacterized protein n=1 Tax=Gilvimarinus gilvus TaxID=3058038 RepID=A0ABU4RY91_9GAMM|nr:hypothetical protein [Gilvimarinus sp. SDUM040013]MDO3386555.1 hypothetical protein [Gilvimarinus sp. SDUM040013]MDX6849131.1 hypothetical protein [Gilvimarinus sp. SDUM040013]